MVPGVLIDADALRRDGRRFGPEQMTKSTWRASRFDPTGLRARGQNRIKMPMTTAILDWIRGGARRNRQADQRLQQEVDAHRATMLELETARRELETARGELRRSTADWTRERDVLQARFATVLCGARAYMFCQDRELRYTFVDGPNRAEAAARMLGRADDEILAPPERERVIALKRRVLDTGVSDECEVSYPTPDGRAVFALHVDPVLAPDRSIVGINCVAVDVSPVRAREGEQRKLGERLQAELQRYETALRRSNITIFTQDRALRYTSASTSMFDRGTADIVGRTDQDLLPSEDGSAVVALKRIALETGGPADGELGVANGATRHWYDFHIEPLRDVTGGIIGLTGAAVDITERKESEAHLRMLMRELTHRSKNLLAVIQAMARQTARHSQTTEGFLERFAARLQALATSHDLLVQESWHGVSLRELTRSQLGLYLDQAGAQISIDGPGIVLRPEAAQDLGLALHELAANAAKFGALSVPAGKVLVTWCRLPPQQGRGVEIVWKETGGPAVKTPARRGFGSLVIERNLPRALNADVALAFRSEGVHCRMVLPENQLSLGG
jgi:PAS domain S-box-containing protein